MRALKTAHVREHSLEMQLPFVAALKPRVSIVPLVMGHQTRETAMRLADALAACLSGRQARMIASPISRITEGIPGGLARSAGAAGHRGLRSIG